MKDGVSNPKYLIDIKQLPELRRLEVTDDRSLTVGACVTVNELLAFAPLPAGMAALRHSQAIAVTVAPHVTPNSSAVPASRWNAWAYQRQVGRICRSA